MNELVVTSHVGRDLLQGSQHFKTDRSVVWEYVVNSLQYVDPGVSPRVVVTMNEKRKVIQIGDNGRGMSFDDLDHFFTMHGENPDRAEGRIGRGMFGTGKSAVFGIADELKLSSVKAGRRTSVRLRRDEIERMKDGAPIPVEVLERDQTTGEPNGTVVTIGGIHLRRLDRAGVISYIERHLAHYPADVEVFVDHHLCEYREPEVAEQRRFEPSGEDARLLGSASLTIKVAKGPLLEELRGIHIFSHDNWHESTLAGSERKPMSEFIFGSADIPALEEYEGAIAPFDNTRSGRLNPANEVVAAIYRFIGPRIDEVRRELVARERERARSEDAKKLAEQASRISEVLSEDFAAFRVKLQRVKSAAIGRDLGKSFETIGGEEGPWTEGGDELASPIETDGDTAPGGGGEGADPPAFPTPVEKDSEGSTTGSPSGGTETGKRSPRGGLSIEYRNLGISEPRGSYRIDGRVILINLDHPQVEAAYKLGGPEEPNFVRYAAEIAIAEYAVALATELAETYTIPDEAIFDIHDTIDRVSRRFAALYQE